MEFWPSNWTTMSQNSFDTALDVLANKVRRRLLVALLEHDPQDATGPQILSDGEMGDKDRESLRIAMFHSHLPKLEEEGFIEWDRDSNSVHKGTHFGAIRPLLELLQNHSDELPDGWP